MRIVALVALLQAAFLTATEVPSGVRHVDWKSKADLLKRKEDCEMGYWKMKHAQESANRSEGLADTRLIHPWGHEPEGRGGGQAPAFRVARCRTQEGQVGPKSQPKVSPKSAQSRSPKLASRPNVGPKSTQSRPEVEVKRSAFRHPAQRQKFWMARMAPP